jgi:hypothetical protein
MTSLERALANILQTIAVAKEAGNVSALAALVHRKNTICAALAAPEQSWHVAHVLEPVPVSRLREWREKTSLSPLVTAQGIDCLSRA